MVIEFIQGKREDIGLGEESTFGTGVNAEFTLGRNARFEPSDKEDWKEILGSSSDSVNVTYDQGPKVRSGRLIFTPQDWRFLKFVTGRGSTDVTDAGADPYTHTFTLSNLLGSFTMDRFFQHASAGYGVRYVGCQANAVSLAWERGVGAGSGLMTAALDIIAKDSSKIAANNNPAAPSTAGFQFRNVILTLESSEVVEILGGTFDIANNLSDGRYANFTLNRTKEESAVQKRTYTGNIRIHTKNSDWFDNFVGGSALSGTNTLNFKRGTNDQCLFTFTNLRLWETPDPTNLEGNNETTLGWSADSIAIVATDSIATY